MDINFLTDLCSYCTEDLVPPQDEKQSSLFFKLEQEFIDHMGYDFSCNTKRPLVRCTPGSLMPLF